MSIIKNHSRHMAIQSSGAFKLRRGLPCNFCMPHARFEDLSSEGLCSGAGSFHGDIMANTDYGIQCYIVDVNTVQQQDLFQMWQCSYGCHQPTADRTIDPESPEVGE